MKLHIRNFRSIKEQDLDLTRVTVVYGANGAGKSSLLYALLTLKNIILNPNQNPNGSFNYTFTKATCCRISWTNRGRIYSVWLFILRV